MTLCFSSKRTTTYSTYCVIVSFFRKKRNQGQITLRATPNYVTQKCRPLSIDRLFTHEIPKLNVWAFELLIGHFRSHDLEKVMP